MPDRSSDTALLAAVELLMGQFSEQILALLEAHARGDVAPEEFEARIREVVGAVSPEALARHPGRLAMARPALPAAPAAAPEPPAILDGVSGFDVLPEFDPEAAPAEPGAPAPEPAAAAPDLPLPEPEPGPVPPGSATVLDGVSGCDPLPEFSREVLAGQGPPVPEPAAGPGLLVLDGVSGYERLPEPAAGEPPPARPPARPGAAPRPAAPPAAPAEAPRPRKAPSKGEAAPPVPSRAPEGAPAAPAKPVPQPSAPAGPAKSPAPPPRRLSPGGGGGSVVVSGRLAGDDIKGRDRPALGFGEKMFGAGGDEAPGADHATSFVSRQVRRDLREKGAWKSPGKAALLSALLPGVGDFYLGRVATGLVFYLAFYVLLVLLILRGDLVLAPVLAILALVSSGVSWLAANKHNDAIHRLQDASSLQRKTRETTFTFDTGRRRR